MLFQNQKIRMAETLILQFTKFLYDQHSLFISGDVIGEIEKLLQKKQYSQKEIIFGDIRYFYFEEHCYPQLRNLLATPNDDKDSKKIELVIGLNPNQLLTLKGYQQRLKN